VGFEEVFGFDLATSAGEHEHDVRQPEWFGPPGGELGASVPVASVIGRSERGVVALSHALAYTTGIAFEFVSQARGLTTAESHRLFHEQHGPWDDLPDGFLRIGFELPGGVRVSNLERAPFSRQSEEDPPSGPVLMQHGGGGGQSSGNAVSLSTGYWLWPLPDNGPLSISCEWPIVNIPLSTVEIDAGQLRAAVANVVQLWP
jgi:hypothetical protein